MSSTKTAPSIREQLLEVITALTMVYADETNESGLPDWPEAHDEEVMAFIHAWKELTKPFYGNARDYFIQEMNAMGATEKIEGDYTAAITDTVEYNDDVLAELMVHIPLTELLEIGAVKEVPAKLAWNLTKAKPLAKRGKEIKDIIDKARGVKYRTLSVTRKD